MKATKIAYLIGCLLLAVSCGNNALTSYAGLSGQLKVVNNTGYDASVQRKKCGAEEWGSVTVVKAGKDKEWSLDAGCFDLTAVNARHESWGTTAYVSDGQRTTLWVEWH